MKYGIYFIDTICMGRASGLSHIVKPECPSMELYACRLSLLSKYYAKRQFSIDPGVISSLAFNRGDITSPSIST